MMANAVKLSPVLNKDGSILLHDIYIDGCWIGSRRTKEQAQRAAKVFVQKVLEDAKKDAKDRHR